MLHFIEWLEHPEMIGVNPEMAHESMAGLSFSGAVGQALWAGKLFHIDLNDQEFGRYDQDFRFGSVNLKHAFFLVKLLEDKANGLRAEPGDFLVGQMGRVAPVDAQGPGIGPVE